MKNKLQYLENRTFWIFLSWDGGEG
jgi:hypothetical protein